MTTVSDYGREPASSTKSRPASVLSQTKRASVLVVEDHADTRLMIKTLLELRGGVSVIEAENGEMAVALAENLLFDLILMDGSLPLLNGYEATRRIRKSACGMGAVPIVFLSGHALPANEAEAIAAGCTDYLVKPFDFEEWDRVLDRHLAQK